MRNLKISNNMEYSEEIKNLLLSAKANKLSDDEEFELLEQACGKNIDALQKLISSKEFDIISIAVKLPKSNVTLQQSIDFGKLEIQSLLTNRSFSPTIIDIFFKRFGWFMTQALHRNIQEKLL